MRVNGTSIGGVLVISFRNVLIIHTEKEREREREREREKETPCVPPFVFSVYFQTPETQEFAESGGKKWRLPTREEMRTNVLTTALTTGKYFKRQVKENRS